MKFSSFHSPLKAIHVALLILFAQTCYGFGETTCKFVDVTDVEGEKYLFLKFTAKNPTSGPLVVNGTIKSKNLFVPHPNFLTWEVLPELGGPTWTSLPAIMASYRKGNKDIVWKSGEELEFYASVRRLSELSKRRTPVSVRLRLSVRNAKGSVDFLSEKLLIERFEPILIH